MLAGVLLARPAVGRGGDPETWRADDDGDADTSPAPGWERLLGDFEENWRASWHEQKLAGATAYEVAADDESGPALRAVSRGAASGLWRTLEIEPGRVGLIRWRWRIEETLSDNQHERQRSGDDYAARVMVIFEPRFPEFRTRVICYVWAASEPAGSVYPSPFASNVATFVLETGDRLAGDWVGEERDFVADYRRYFGRQPEMVSGVAILVDTDNTGSRATSWFDDLEIKVP